MTSPPSEPAPIPADLRRRLGIGETRDRPPAWLRRTRGESRLPATAAVAVAIGLQLLLPGRLAMSPRLLLPALELLLVLALLVVNPGRIESRHPALRAAGLTMVALVTLANAVSAARLVDQLLSGGVAARSPAALLGAGGAVYVTNIIAFALWYWEVDRGGPAARAHATQVHPDLMFPQMSSPEMAPEHWEPRFFDYLYLSFTNATAFSPTDTMPMTRWAKALMMVQSSVAVVVVVLVVARAVNVLG